LRQFRDHTGPLPVHRELTPVKASSNASASVDLPDPLRPAMTTRPGPGGSGKATFGPIPRNPCTVIDFK
jgi:hypothetical protein